MDLPGDLIEEDLQLERKENDNQAIKKSRNGKTPGTPTSAKNQVDHLELDATKAALFLDTSYASTEVPNNSQHGSMFKSLISSVKKAKRLFIRAQRYDDKMDSDGTEFKNTAYATPAKAVSTEVPDTSKPGSLSRRASIFKTVVSSALKAKHVFLCASRYGGGMEVDRQPHRVQKFPVVALFSQNGYDQESQLPGQYHGVSGESVSAQQIIPNRMMDEDERSLAPTPDQQLEQAICFIETKMIDDHNELNGKCMALIVDALDEAKRQGGDSQKIEVNYKPKYGYCTQTKVYMEIQVPRQTTKPATAESKARFLRIKADQVCHFVTSICGQGEEDKVKEVAQKVVKGLGGVVEWKDLHFDVDDCIVVRELGGKCSTNCIVQYEYWMHSQIFWKSPTWHQNNSRRR